VISLNCPCQQQEHLGGCGIQPHMSVELDQLAPWTTGTSCFGMQKPERPRATWPGLITKTQRSTNQLRFLNFQSPIGLSYCQPHVIVLVITNQDSTSSRLLPGSSYSCCIRNLHALVHKQCHPVHITAAHEILQRHEWQLCNATAGKSKPSQRQQNYLPAVSPSVKSCLLDSTKLAQLCLESMEI
jgi:hypothetical protein